MRILHIITGLNDGGGAEMMLYRLLTNARLEGTKNSVVSLMEVGSFAARFEGHGIPCYGLAMRRGRLSVRGFVRLLRIVRRERPDIVQTWMYHANLLGGLAARLAGIGRTFWGIHHANLSPGLNKASTRLVAGICAPLSKVVPRTTVFCSQSSAQLHWRLGYSRARSVVIPNGFDTEIFKPIESARGRLVRELGLRHDAILIGLVARFDALKDHENFCRAVGRLIGVPNVHFVLVGQGINAENLKLTNWISDAGASDRTHLLGLRDDMPQVYAALDILTLSSAGEAFPNVLGEAMASGVPCVVTDVGDCATIVGDTGIVVPPGDAEALASGWLRLIEQSAEQRRSLGNLARQRILDNFSLDSVASKYLSVYAGEMPGTSLQECQIYSR